MVPLIGINHLLSVLGHASKASGVCKLAASLSSRTCILAYPCPLATSKYLNTPSSSFRFSFFLLISNLLWCSARAPSSLSHFF